jgi:hypothetical protein
MLELPAVVTRPPVLCMSDSEVLRPRVRNRAVEQCADGGGALCCVLCVRWFVPLSYDKSVAFSRASSPQNAS